MFKFMSEDKLGRILAALVFSKSVTTYTQLLLIISLGYLTTYNTQHTTPYRSQVKMFQYHEEFEYSLQLVKKCGDVIKSAFTKDKNVW